jgi:tetratricopeptide (TPR) repeat protein
MPMARSLAALTALCCLAVPATAADPLADARTRWLHGNYEEARTAYSEALKDPKLSPAAAIGLSRVQESLGEFERAAATLDEAAKGTKSADVLARRAELRYARGDWDGAATDAEAALKLADKHLLARWVRAQVLRDRGEAAKANAEFLWFVRFYNEKDEPTPEELLLIGQAALEHARANVVADNTLNDQFEFVLKDVYGEAFKADKDLWQAEYLAGSLLLEKYNRGEAEVGFANALKVNPSAAEVLVARGTAALQRYEVKDAEQACEDALKVNPRLPAALRLKADIHFMSGEFDKALKAAEEAREVNPRDAATLGRVAAALFLTRRKDEFDAVAAEAAKYDPKPGRFYAELAERLEERRVYEPAERFFRKSAELRPDLPVAKSALGLLFMRMAKEDEARTVLKDAFEADKFNVRVANTLKVLRHLEKYEVKRTPHFEIRFDPKTDRVLAEYMAPYLEVLYADYSKQFGYAPKGPILIEVFNNHEMFSGRTVALPDLHTIGACTGKMFAMVSPRGKGIPKAFNWGRVVRHELVHIFNLEQTDFQVPHWLTEGLAVANEGFPRPPSWNGMLKARVASGDLLNLDNITLGFIRPKSPEEWQLAYCQSNLYVEYVKKEHGDAAVAGLLDAYRDGLGTDAALRRACKVDQPTFEAGYRRFLAEVVRNIKSGGKSAEKPMKLEELKEAVEKNPDDADLSARLADVYSRRSATKADARRLAEGVLAKKPGHPLASVVKARLLEGAGEAEEARKLLEAARDAKDPDPRVLLALGRMLFEEKKFADAARIFEEGAALEPDDTAWLAELAKVYGQLDEKARLRDVLRKLTPGDPDNLTARKKLLKLCVEDGKWDEAERAARECLEIDVTDKDAQVGMLKALEEQGRKADADRLRGLFEPAK